MVAKLADPGYALELSSPVPTIGLVSMIIDINANFFCLDS